jgi:hypothetical protein
VCSATDLPATLMLEGLFAAYRPCIVPVVLSNGKPLFGRSTGHLKLKLLEAPQTDAEFVLIWSVPIVRG